MPDLEDKNNVSARPPNSLCLASNDMSKAWKLWYQQFEWYSLVIGLEKKPENVKVAIFMSSIGPESVSIFNTFPDETKLELNAIVKAFDAYFSPKTNVTYERFVFNKLVQTQNEKFDDFVTELLRKSKSCDFGTLHDSLIKDRIVVGVYNDTDREKLLSEEELTLDKAIKICRASEQARSQINSMKNEPLKVETVKNKYRNKAKSDTKQVVLKQSKEYPCKKCGRNHGKNECFAFKKECYSCHKLGHFSKFCRSKQISTIARSTSKETASEDNFIVNSISEETNVTDWYETGKFSTGLKVKFKLDTGAQCNVLPCTLAEKAGLKLRLSKVQSLLSFSNHKIKVTHEAFSSLQIKGNNYMTRFLIVNENVQPVLGKNASVEMGLIKRLETISMSENLITTEENIGCLKGFKYDIDLIDNPKLEIFPARRIPYSIRNNVKEELDRMQRAGIIKPVNSPTPSVSPMVIVRRNGKIRVCIDPSSLNKNLKRRHYPLRTLEEIAAKINESKWFTVLDCKKGFWQLPVTERTSKYLTMATPWGRYSYLRLPMGLSSAPEVFQQIIERLIGGKKGVECAMDDILIHASSKDKLQKISDEVTRILKDAGLTLNNEKCVYAENKVKFLGHIVTQEGLKADPEKIETISKLKVPQDVTALQRFLGMVTYLAKFIPNLSEITQPLRELCKKNVEWQWEKEHQLSFERLKESLKTLPVLKYFDVNAPITLSVDSSKHAVGAVLIQEGRPVAYAAKALDKTQQNYAQIEKEAYAIKFGCLRFHQYVWGSKSLTVETDHKPLVSISKKPLHCAPLRLQRLMLDILPYRPVITYKKGTELYVADTLSRDCKLRDVEDSKEMQMEVHIVVPLTKTRTQQLIEALKTDEELSHIMKLTLDGWPEDIGEVPENVKKYWTFRDEFGVYENILFRGDRVVIPKELRQLTLKQAHLGHLGIQRTLSRARENVYWHGMNNDIQDYVKKCKACQYHQRDNYEEPIILNKVPERPWEIVATDIYQLHQKNYLVIADSYSGFFDFAVLGNLSSSSVIQELKKWFSTHGVPETLLCDEGTQLISRELKGFAEEWNFSIQTSSPYHKRSNGLAERYVQEAKNLISKCVADGTDIYLALLNNRNTPRGKLGSPVQRLFGRRTKGILPTKFSLLKPKIIEGVSKNLKAMRLTQKKYRDSGSRLLPSFKEGEQILLRKGHRDWRPAEVVTKAPGPRSFLVKTPEGRIYRRNSWFLRPDVTVRQPTTESSESIDGQEVRANSTPGSKPDDIAVSEEVENNSTVDDPDIEHSPKIHDRPRSRYGRSIKKPIRLDL